jgi:hypothetical protein
MFTIVENVNVSCMVQLFKGMASKVVREEFSELKEFLWGKAGYLKAPLFLLFSIQTELFF